MNYSNPPTDTSDAILAFDMDSGRLLWSHQFNAGDSYNFACGAEDKTNCPKLPFVDYDFGHSPVLRNRILFAGDKGGTVYALDADQRVSFCGSKRSLPAASTAASCGAPRAMSRASLTSAFPTSPQASPKSAAAWSHFNSDTGEKLWMTPAPKPTCITTPGCSAAQPAPVTVIPGVAFLGSSDGHIRAYETTKGAIIWDFDTAKDFETVNGVKAHGGSIISMGPVVAGGTLYVTSGYGGNGMPGNVLLAFSR